MKEEKDSRMGAKSLSVNYSTEYVKALEILIPREVEVLKEVAAGRTSKEIGKKLSISYRTVQKNRENICKKLGLSGHRSLFLWCEKHMKSGI